jgi:uncharacterized protein (TIGR04222 family)
MEGIPLFEQLIAGPTFLIGYVLLVVATLLFLRRRLAQLDHTDELSVPEIPFEPEPYAVAYLRRGVREVARLAMLSLVEQGYLVVDRSDKSKPRLMQVPRQPDLAGLDRIERRIYDRCLKSCTPREVATDSKLNSEIEDLYRCVRERFEAEHLLTPKQLGPVAWQLWLGGASILLGVGLVRLNTGLAANRPVGLLIIAMIVAVVAAFAVCRWPRLSKRGRAYLQRLRLAFEHLQLQQKTADASGSISPGLLLLVSLFGFGALANTTYAAYTDLFPTSSGQLSAGAAGDGCGSCGGCGGDCGGCGGCGCD